jgi:hypothetical protein
MNPGKLGCSGQNTVEKLNTSGKHGRKVIILFKTLFVKILSCSRKLCNHTDGYIEKKQAYCDCKKARNTIEGKLGHQTAPVKASNEAHAQL